MRKMKLLFIVVILITVIVGCHGVNKETCRQRNGNIFCQEKELKEIPSDIVWPEATTLLLYGNQIESTEQLDIHLSMFKKLQTLDMHINRLNRVPKAPTTIKKLDLDANRIKRISKDLNSLKELKVLSLRSNKLNDASFDSQTFSENNKLEEINLDYNQLEFIPKNLPLSLKKLTLKNNSIVSIQRQPLDRLVNLQFLMIEDNLITNMQIERSSFSQLNNLKDLNLQNNKLTDVPLGLPYTLKNLYLSHNQIEYIKIEDGPHSGTLFKFEELKYVDLSYNKLKSVQPRSLDSVKAASFKGNKWICDCWLDYFRSWLETSISNKDLTCDGGPLNLLSKPIKELDDLSCESRYRARNFISASVNHNSIKITWQHPYKPPAFVQTLVLYGECVNCNERTMYRNNIAVEDMTSRYKTTNFTSVDKNANKLATQLNGLKSNMTYHVCIYDSEQNVDDVINNQCRLIRTSPQTLDSSSMDPVYLALIVLSTLLLLTVIATATYCLFHHQLPGFSKFKRKTTTPRLSPVDLERQFLPRNHQSSPPGFQGHPEDYLNQQLRPQPSIPVTTHSNGSYPNHHSNHADYNTQWSNRTYAECGSYHMSQQRHPTREPAINQLIPPMFQPRDDDHYHDNRDAAVDAASEFQSLLPGTKNPPAFEFPRVPVRNSPNMSNLSSLVDEGNTRLSTPSDGSSDQNGQDTMSTNYESSPSPGHKVSTTTHNNDVRSDDVISPYDHLIRHSSSVTSPSFLRNSSALSRDSEYQQVNQNEVKWYER